MCGARRKKKKRTEKWFIRKRKNTRDGCPFVLPSPLLFGYHFQWLLQHSSSEYSCSAPHRMQQSWIRLAQPQVFPHGRCLWTICHPTLGFLLSTLSNLHLTSLFHFCTHTTEPWLENTQASSFSKSPLILTNSRKGFLLICSRRFSKNSLDAMFMK